MPQLNVTKEKGDLRTLQENGHERNACTQTAAGSVRQKISMYVLVSEQNRLDGNIFALL